MSKSEQNEYKVCDSMIDVADATRSDVANIEGDVELKLVVISLEVAGVVTGSLLELRIPASVELTELVVRPGSVELVGESAGEVRGSGTGLELVSIIGGGVEETIPLSVEVAIAEATSELRASLFEDDIPLSVELVMSLVDKLSEELLISVELGVAESMLEVLKISVEGSVEEIGLDTKSEDDAIGISTDEDDVIESVSVELVLDMSMLEVTGESVGDVESLVISGVELVSGSDELESEIVTTSRDEEVCPSVVESIFDELCMSTEDVDMVGLSEDMSVVISELILDTSEKVGDTKEASEVLSDVLGNKLLVIVLELRSGRSKVVRDEVGSTELLLELIIIESIELAESILDPESVVLGPGSVKLSDNAADEVKAGLKAGVELIIATDVEPAVGMLLGSMTNNVASRQLPKFGSEDPTKST